MNGVGSRAERNREKKLGGSPVVLVARCWWPSAGGQVHGWVPK
jgi:hypothetical protein